MKRLFLLALVCVIYFGGCHREERKESEEEMVQLEPDYDEVDKSLTHKEKLWEVREAMLSGHGEKGVEPALNIDRKIAHAVWQLGRTLDTKYRPSWLRTYVLGKHRLGFIEVTDINRDPPSKLHKYISEKVLTFSYLQPEITQTMSIVEHFTTEDVKKVFLPMEIGLKTLTDRKLARKLGKLRKLDIIEVGTLTLYPSYLDLNLRMVETRRGRIIAVGSVKIKLTAITTQWLKDFSYGTPLTKPANQTGEYE